MSKITWVASEAGGEAIFFSIQRRMQRSTRWGASYLMEETLRDYRPASGQHFGQGSSWPVSGQVASLVAFENPAPARTASGMATMRAYMSLRIPNLRGHEADAVSIEERSLRSA